MMDYYSLLFLVVTCVLQGTQVLAENKFCDGDMFCMEWSGDASQITISMTGRTTDGYVSLGFADQGSVMGPADCVVGFVMNGQPILEDRSTDDDNDVNDPDAQQDYTLISYSQGGGFTTFTFSRPLDTGDGNDRVIVDDDMNIIWAISTRAPELDDGVWELRDHLDLFGYGKFNVHPVPSIPTQPVASGQPGQGSWCSGGAIFCLDWTLEGDQSVLFTMKGKAQGYVSVGFSDRAGRMGPGDVIFGWVDASGNAHISDGATDANRNCLSPDAQQDVEVVSSSNANGEITITFRRVLDTGDLSDRVISDASMNVIWATADIVPSGDGTFAKHNRDGSTQINFFSAGAAAAPAAPATPGAPAPPAAPAPAAPVTPGTGSWCSGGSVFCLEWTLEQDPVQSVLFTMKGKAQGYTSVGFSDRAGRMGPGDVIFGWVDASGNAHISDGATDANHNCLSPDAQQNAELVSSSNANGEITITFRRVLDTGDLSDRVISDATMNVIWANSDTVPPGDGTFAQHNRDGSTQINFFSVGTAATPPTTPATPATPATPVPVATSPVSTAPGTGSWCSGGSVFCVEWTMEETTARAPQSVLITMKGQAQGYTSVGFSDRAGRMGPGDVIFGWVDASGNAHISDGATDADRNCLSPDAQQDAELVSSSKANGELSITFRRALNTGDSSDRVISDTSMNVIWANSDTVPSGDGTFAKHNRDGSTQMNFFSVNTPVVATSSPSPSPAAAPTAVTVTGSSGAGSWCSAASRFCLDWTMEPAGVARASPTMLFTMVGKATGYVSVGFSDRPGLMGPGDVIFGWVDASGNAHVSDGATDANQNCLSPDAQQDIELVSSSKANGEISITFRRALDTGDSRDRVIGTESMNVIWANSDEVPSPFTVFPMHNRDGATQINFSSGTINNVGVDYQFYVPALILAGFILLLVSVGLVARTMRAQSIISTHPLVPLHKNIFHSLTLDALPAMCDMSLGEFAVCLVWVGALVAVTQLKLIDLTGRMAAFALGTVMLPVTRNSLWVYAIGISFERAIKFHRWVSRLAVLFSLVHAILQMTDKGADVAWEMEQDDWGLGVMYGTVSLILMMLISLLAIEPIRRRFFEVFYYPHFLALPAVVLAMLHAKVVLWIMIAPLTLYVIDKSIRVTRGCATSYTAQLTRVTGGCRIEAWQMSQAAFTFLPGQYYFLRIPAISILESHPLSITCGTGWSSVTFLAKDMGSNTWTGKLRALAETGETVTAYLDGPYGSFRIAQPEAYRIVYLIGGGVGITPMVSIAETLLGSHSRMCERVYFIWTSRNAAAIHEWFPGQIEAMRCDPAFDVLLFQTDKSSALDYGMPRGDWEMGIYRHPGTPDGGYSLGHASSRPDFAGLLGVHAGQGSDVGVFVCGPADMLTTVQGLAQLNGFDWHKETFAL